MTLVLKSRVASDGAFCISFTNVYFHGNFGHCLGARVAHLGQCACPKWVRCLPNMGKRAAHFLTFLLSLPMIGMLVENNANQRNISAII